MVLAEWCDLNSTLHAIIRIKNASGITGVRREDGVSVEENRNASGATIDEINKLVIISWLFVLT